MAFYNIDPQGNKIEITKEEALADLMRLIEKKKRQHLNELNAKINRDLKEEADRELTKLNKHTERAHKMATNEKDTILRTIIEALGKYPQFLTTTELYISGTDGDYSIKVTKKKNPVPELHK